MKSYKKQATKASKHIKPDKNTETYSPSFQPIKSNLYKPQPVPLRANA